VLREVRSEVASAKSVSSTASLYEAVSVEPGKDLGAIFLELEPVFPLPRACLARPFFDLVGDLSMAKSSRFFPFLISAAIHLGIAPRPAQVSDRSFGLRYLGATLRPS
jgi:hypothetical protein